MDGIYLFIYFIRYNNTIHIPREENNLTTNGYAASIYCFLVFPEPSCSIVSLEGAFLSASLWNSFEQAGIKTFIEQLKRKI